MLGRVTTTLVLALSAATIVLSAPHPQSNPRSTNPIQCSQGDDNTGGDQENIGYSYCCNPYMKQDTAQGITFWRSNCSPITVYPGVEGQNERDIDTKASCANEGARKNTYCCKPSYIDGRQINYCMPSQDGFYFKNPNPPADPDLDCVVTGTCTIGAK